jgi:hypothetical protein
MSARFNLQKALAGDWRIARGLLFDAMHRRQYDRRSAARREQTHPGARVPVFKRDQVPDFEVVVVVEEQRGNRWVAHLHWYLLGHDGRFPVIPAGELDDSTPVEPTMPPHGFKQERLAVIEAAHQASALTDQFMEWATNQGE